MRRIGLKTSATKRTWNPKMGGSSPSTPVILPPASGLYEALPQSAVGITLILQMRKPGCRKVARPTQVSQQGASPQPPAAAFLCSLSDCLEVPRPQVSNAVAQRWLLCLLGPVAVPGSTVPPATADKNPLPILGNVTSHFLRD